jgi:hypothetical protein
MSKGSSLSGYRSYPLPEWLGELERSGTSQRDSAYSLICADKDALVWFQRLEDDVRAVVKMYRHRGPISWWREKQFLFRVQREFEALAHLERSGIPCSRPLFWCYGHSADHGRYEVLATREIVNAVQLDKFIRSQDDRAGDAALRSVFEAVHRMHGSGLHHGALYPRNILLTENATEKPDVYIIDLPKAISFPYALPGTRMAEIDLLQLSLGVAGELGLDICAPLLKHYGMDEKSVSRFMDRLKRGEPSKLMRNLHRAECEVRELLAKLGL